MCLLPWCQQRIRGRGRFPILVASKRRYVPFSRIDPGQFPFTARLLRQRADDEILSSLQSSGRFSDVFLVKEANDVHV